jgi:type IV secretory pathway VirB2 component (pilin)
MKTLSHRKPLAALAGVTAALAFAVPAASASAATTTTPIVDPQVCQLLNFAQGPFGPTASFFGGASLGATLAQAGSSVGCAPPPAPTSLLPGLPFLP